MLVFLTTFYLSLTVISHNWIDWDSLPGNISIHHHIEVRQSNPRVQDTEDQFVDEKEHEDKEQDLHG